MRMKLSRTHTVALAGVVMAHAGPIAAQSSNTLPATIISSTQLKALDDSLPHTSLSSLALGRGSGYTYSLTHRAAPGVIELHMAWNDVFVIQSGSATLLTGGLLAGAKAVSVGELREGVLTGATAARVSPGDVVIIPAGTPHQFQLSPGEQVTYLAFKVTVAP